MYTQSIAAYTVGLITIDITIKICNKLNILGAAIKEFDKVAH